MIRIHNEKGGILVDGKHYNLAFLDKKRLVNHANQFYGYAEFDISGGVAVLSLENGRTAGMYSTVIHGNRTRVYAAIGSVTECYLFGRPSLANTQGRAGLRIYSETNHQIVFDSRLSYLQIIGFVQPNMMLDPSRKYGLLFIRNTPTEGGGGYDYDIETEYLWSLIDNKVYYTMHSLLYSRPYNLNSVPASHGPPPLLVDLTGF